VQDETDQGVRGTPIRAHLEIRVLVRWGSDCKLYLQVGEVPEGLLEAEGDAVKRELGHLGSWERAVDRPTGKPTR
jgi:hypothetical protein